MGLFGFFNSLFSQPGMELELESGKKIKNPTEKDILDSIAGELFAILSEKDICYIQCAGEKDPPYEYCLNYSDESGQYQALPEPISLEKVQSAFIKYLRKDDSFKSDFEWTQMNR